MSEVWLVNHYAVSPDLPGGTRHYDLATELVQRGFRVKIFACGVNLALRESVKVRRHELYAFEQRDGVEFVWIAAAGYSRNDWRRAWNMLTFSRNFVRVAGRLAATCCPEVIVGSSPHPFAALAAQRVARQVGAHFWLELRDLWPQALVDMGGVSELHPGVRTMRFLENYLYARAEKLIVLAQGSRRYLEQRGISPERVLFLPNGVHLGHFQTNVARSDARARYGFTRFTIIYTGAHSQANSLHTVLEAAQRLPTLPVEFVLVGDGPAKAELVHQAESQGILNVRFLPPVPKAEVPALLHAADAAVITLKNAKAFAYSISPNKLFDYMAAGLPVVCAVPGDMADLVERAGAGLVCQPESASELAAAIQELWGMSEPERLRMGQNGSQHVAAHYRREVLADQLAHCLKDLTRRHETTGRKYVV